MAIKQDEMDLEFSKKLAKEIGDSFQKCFQCGTCTARCPAGNVSQYRVRKLMRMAQLGLKERIFDSDEIWNCTTCSTCKILCPWGVDTVSTILRLRAEAVDAGHENKKHDPLVKSLQSYDNPWLQPRSARRKWYKKLDNVVDLSKKPGEADVLYYVGCTATFDPRLWNMAQSVVKVLAKAGITVGVLGKEEKCCGGTVRGVGHPDIFEGLAKRNIEDFNNSGVDTIIFSCPGCLNTVMNAYKDIGEIKPRMVHVVEYVAELLEKGKLKLDKDVGRIITYHDPCHLGKHCEVFDPPRDILKAIPGVEFKEMDFIRENSWCCGAGGGVKTAYPDRATELASNRLKEAEDTGADTITSACSFCYQNLLDGIKQSDSKLEMKDIMEIVAEAIEE
ncbi:(Fe-S)-binding protein [archaeon]|nr:MAG: (Fe-S)-binding protein [archaeon]